MYERVRERRSKDRELQGSESHLVCCRRNGRKEQTVADYTVPAYSFPQIHLVANIENIQEAIHRPDVYETRRRRVE
jgi:hypothetical protein